MKTAILLFSCLWGIHTLSYSQKNKTDSDINIYKQSPDWYSSKKAENIADNMLIYQSKKGAWPKNRDITIEPKSKKEIKEAHSGKNSNTIDNGATTAPIYYLGLMVNATSQDKYKSAFYKGLDYLFKAQYNNGGWPQFYPLRKGYYTAITFNDDAMINVMKLLDLIAKKEYPFDFVDREYQKKASEAVAKGIDCILKTQIKVNGHLTAWCAQHDQENYQPVWARNFEPPSISGSESAKIVAFLMEIEHPNKEVINAIQSAIIWFKSSQINGLKYIRFKDKNGIKDRKVVPDKSAEPLWARFYEIETNKPIFIGRDKIVHYNFAELEQERRSGYAYYGTWASELINKHYPKWLEENNINP